MCWSGEASTILATIGLSSTAYFYYKKEPAALCAALGYFSLMEVLQAYTIGILPGKSRLRLIWCCLICTLLRLFYYLFFMVPGK